MEQANVSLLIAGEAHLPGGGAVRVHRSFSEPPCVPRLTDVPGHPLHTDRPPFPRTPPCTHCVTARHLLLALRLVRKHRITGGIRPTSFAHPNCLPVSPRGGILHSGPNPGKQKLYSTPWHTLSRLGRGSTDRMCLDRAIGCGGGTAPRTSPYCRSLCQSGNS